MEFDTTEGDFTNRSECGNRGISGMGSVIVTVSGYHGTERFRLIKLIAETGASYVGALSKSTTHLVCWEFKGKKFDIANSLGIKVISHQWFEDCLKQGIRVPEDPYTMKCGKQAGPLSWKISHPSVDSKKPEVALGKRKILHDRSNTFHCHENLEISSHSSDVKHMEQSCPYLRKSCSSSMASTKEKILICNDAGTSSKSLSVRKKHSVTGNVYFDHLDHVSTGFEDMHSCIESHDRVMYKEKDPVVTFNISNGEEDFVARVNITQESADIVDEITLPSSITQGLNMEHKNYRKDQLRKIEEHRNTTEFGTDSSCCLSNNLTVTELPIVRSSTLNGNCSSGERGKKETEGAENLVETVELNILTDLSCVICLTSFSSTRGVLPCGHRFCYSCIKAWADHVASNKKIPACPLCKAIFTNVMKVEGAASCDQKIFSQTIPDVALNMDFFIVPDRVEENPTISPRESICSECRHHEPEDLLLNCHVCSGQWVHSCCLDPPLVPWTCVHCRDLRMLYQLYR